MSKGNMIEISQVTLEVVPSDSEMDIKIIEDKVRHIQKDGLKWLTGSSIQPFVFGLQKLIISCEITDAVSISNIQEELLASGDIGQAEVVNFTKVGDQKAAVKPEEKKAEETEEKPVIKGSGEISQVTFEVVPSDSEDDVKEIEKLVRSNQKPGLRWLEGARVEPFVFGLQKLIITCEITNDVSVSTVQEELLATGKIGQAEIVLFSKVGDAPKEKAAEPKSEQKPQSQEKGHQGAQKGGKKGGKGGAGGAPKEAKVKSPLMKMMSAEAQKISKAIKSYEAPFYVGDVALEDDELAVFACADSIHKSQPNAGVMVLSAGVNKLIVKAVVPEAKSSQVNALEWVTEALKVVQAQPAPGGSATSAQGELLGDKDNDRYPIKLKDIARSAAVAFLRTKGAIKDDDSDDDVQLPSFDEL